MAAVRERWLSRRAVALHVTAVILATGCALATWWQITRAEDGNQLSYFYSAMWPAFGILVVSFWWSLLHTDFESAGRRGVQRQQAKAAEAAQAGSDGGPWAGAVATPLATTASPRLDDDPDMAAYNARLAELAAQGPKTWRRPEPVIVRRPE
jgi:hypothetical protein